MSEQSTTKHTPISYSVASDYQVKQWGRTRGDISTEAIPAQIGLEDGRYSFTSPAPTSIEEAHRYNDAARFLATAGNEFEDLSQELSAAKAERDIWRDYCQQLVALCQTATGIDNKSLYAAPLVSEVRAQLKEATNDVATH